MKEFLFTLAAIICCSILTSAQEDRNPTYIIVLENVQYTHSGERQSTGESVHKIMTALATGKTSEQLPQYENDVIAGIVQGLSRARRYRFTEEPLLPEDMVQEGNMAVDAIITNIHGKSETRTSKDKKGNTRVTTSYEGFVEAMLTFKDLKTGLVIKTQSFNGRDNLFFSSSTQDQAIRDAINKMAGSITAWLNKQQPLQANIIESATVKKDKQKEVYIDFGSREGAVVGIHFEVYLIKTIAGREAKQQIGKLKIEAVEGDDISRCKVQSGGKEIKSALDAGAEMKVISTD